MNPANAARGRALPKTTLIRRFDTHRLIASQYRPGSESVLVRIADDDEHLADIFELDHATNDRLLAEHGRALAIGPRELLFDVPNARVVNAAFTHPHPLGGRFNNPQRGAWYAAYALTTAQAEIAYHKSVEYAEIGRFEDSVTYDDYLADVSAELHDLRKDARFTHCLSASSYVTSQALAELLLERAALGIVFPSVRRRGGTCIACFQPAIIAHVRRSYTYRFTWSGQTTPTVRREKSG